MDRSAIIDVSDVMHCNGISLLALWAREPRPYGAGVQGIILDVPFTHRNHTRI